MHDPEPSLGNLDQFLQRQTYTTNTSGYISSGQNSGPIHVYIECEISALWPSVHVPRSCFELVLTPESLYRANSII